MFNITSLLCGFLTRMNNFSSVFFSLYRVFLVVKPRTKQIMHPHIAVACYFTSGMPHEDGRLLGCSAVLSGRSFKKLTN
jgi:hypothetical protein